MPLVQGSGEITITVHDEDGSMWATVAEYPGLFAIGDTEDELFDSIREGLRLQLSEGGLIVHEVELRDPEPAELMHSARTIRKTLVRS